MSNPKFKQPALIYVLGYPFVRKSQVFNTTIDESGNIQMNYFIFDGELLETWEIGQLLGGN